MRLFQTFTSGLQEPAQEPIRGSRQEHKTHKQLSLWSSLTDQILSTYLAIGTADEQSRAFDVLYERYEKKIRNYILKQLNYNEEDSLEAIGDTWLLFWRERASFAWRNDSQAENPLQSWLYGIARNRVKSRVRQNQRDREHVSAVSLETMANFIQARLEDGQPERADESLRQQANVRFNQIMKQLNPTEQQIVTLRYYKGLSYTDISQQLGKSSGAVRTAHTRLIQKLRKTLES
ncbi:MAG: sigma-70 family RNA polymerase sigma factor [Chloroflexota bacterium]